MKTIFLMRHGDAENDSFDHSDHKRALSNKGIEQVNHVGGLIQTSEYEPDLILYSDAKRAVETYDVLKKYLNGGIEAKKISSLYLCDHDEILSQLLGLADKNQSVLLIGHNPSWSTFASHLCGKPLGFSTANCGVFQLESSEEWHTLNFNGCWDFVKTLKP